MSDNEEVELGSPKHVAQEESSVQANITQLRADCSALQSENETLQGEVAGLSATIEVKKELIPQLEQDLTQLQQESGCAPPKAWQERGCLTMPPAHGIGALLLRDYNYGVQERNCAACLRTCRSGFKVDAADGPINSATIEVRAKIKTIEEENRTLK